MIPNLPVQLVRKQLTEFWGPVVHQSWTRLWGSKGAQGAPLSHARSPCVSAV